MGFSRRSIRSWLKKMTELGLCDYSVEEAKIQREKSSKEHRFMKAVIRINDGKIWSTAKDCALEVGSTERTIRKACSKLQFTFLKYNNEPAYFMYLEDYKEKGNVIPHYLDRVNGFIGETTAHRERKIVCLNDNMKFISGKAAAEYYGLPQLAPILIASKQEKATRNGLVFRFYEEYENMTKEEIQGALNFKRKYRSQKVVCLNTGEIFNSLTEAAKKANTKLSYISECINGKRDYAGHDKNTQENFAWCRIEDYKENQEIKYVGTQGLGKPIICLEDLTIYPHSKAIKKTYGIYSHADFLTKICVDGVYDNKHWVYFTDFLLQHSEIKNQLFFYREHIYLPFND